MKLVDQWHAVEERLPAGWHDVRLELMTEQPGDLARAAQVLGPMNPGRVGNKLVLEVHRAGGATGPEAARRLFRRLDESRVWCLLQEDRVETETLAHGESVVMSKRLADAWDEALEPLPAGWTDLLCELALDSSDFLDQAALLCAPLNPTRDRGKLAFVFRCASTKGYGASSAMVSRCLERLDVAGITGSVRVLRVLTDTDNVATQGPVWYVGGKVL